MLAGVVTVTDMPSIADGVVCGVHSLAGLL